MENKIDQRGKVDHPVELTNEAGAFEEQQQQQAGTNNSRYRRRILDFKGNHSQRSKNRKEMGYQD